LPVSVQRKFNGFEEPCSAILDVTSNSLVIFVDYSGNLRLRTFVCIVAS